MKNLELNHMNTKNDFILIQALRGVAAGKR